MKTTKNKCILCNGDLTVEVESNLSKFTCIECDCLQTHYDDEVHLNSDNYFFITNYDSEENINIFSNMNDALNDSPLGNIHKALLNGQTLYYDKEAELWSYQNAYDLYLSNPVQVENKVKYYFEKICSEDKYNLDCQNFFYRVKESIKKNGYDLTANCYDLDVNILKLIKEQ